MVEKIFWVDEFEGKAKGGYFVRNDLFKFIQRLIDAGENPVGIHIDESWNLEVIVEDKDE